jgi:hypothetical protein
LQAERADPPLLRYSDVLQGVSNVQMKRWLVLSLVAALLAVAPLSHATTSPGYNYKIIVTVTDSEVVLSSSVAKRGWIARFVITNKGRKVHVVDIGGLKKRLQPGAKGRLASYLEDRGQFKIKVDGKLRGLFTVR